jgi:hypothetical protein
LPILLFVFNIDTEEGLYLWLREPRVDRNGHTKVHLAVSGYWSDANQGSESQDSAFERIDKEAIDRIVEKVVLWYRERDRLMSLSNGVLDKGRAQSVH